MDMPGYDNYYFLNSDGHIEHLYINPEGGIEGPESFTSPTESIHKLKTIDVASENTADNVSPASGAESHDFGRAEVRLIEDGRGNVSEIQTKDSFDSWDSDKKTDFLEKRVLKKEYSNILESKSHMLPGADAAAIKAGVEKWGDILIRDRQALAILSEQEGVSRQTLQALKISIEEAKKVLDDYDVLDENYVGIEDKIIMEDYIDHPVIAGGAVPDAATENIASAIKPEVFQIAGDLQAKIIKNSLGDIIGIKMLGSMDLDIMREIHNNVMSDLSYEDIASPSMQYGAEALAQKVYLYDKLLEKMSMPDSDYSQIEKILKNSLKRLPESFWDADFYDKYFD